MRVYVYWNLNKDCYSIKALDGADKGRVVAHAASVELANVTFAVGHAARKRILDGAHKSVHAGMRGQLLNTGIVQSTDGLRAVTYNPRKYDSFVYRDTLAPLASAARVVALSTADKRADCYAS